MKFIKFTEYNDNEGETWNFWLQYNGNEKELDKLGHIIETIESGGEISYSLNNALIDESEVDILVKHTRDGYMDYENKITGIFTCPEIDVDSHEHEIPDEIFELLDNNFYKGGIERHFNQHE